MSVVKYRFILYLAAISVVSLPLFYPSYFFDKKQDRAVVFFSGDWPWIQVITDVESRNFFHEQWRAYDIEPLASPIDAREKERVISILAEELKKYPAELLQQNLKKIMLSSTLRIFNIDYGATNVADHIYLTSRGESSGYSDSYLRKTLHHELSSILIRNNSFPIKEWSALFPAIVTASGKPDVVREIEAINEGWVDQNYLSEDLKQGFVSRYGRSSIENDINTYAEKLMTDNAWLIIQAKKYPLIRQKLRLIEDFYQGLGIHVSS